MAFIPELAHIFEALDNLMEYSECALAATEDNNIALVMEYIQSSRSYPMHQARALMLVRRFLSYAKPLDTFISSGGFNLLCSLPRNPAIAGAFARLVLSATSLTSFMEPVRLCAFSFNLTLACSCASGSLAAAW